MGVAIDGRAGRSCAPFMSTKKITILRIATIPESITYLLRGQIPFMKSQGYDIITASSDGDEVEQIKKLGAVHRVIPFTRKITPVQDLYCLALLIILILRHRPTIVHTHTPKAGLLGMMAAWICRVPVRMHTIAGLPWMEASGWKKWLLMRMERLTYAFSVRVYPNSMHMREYLRTTLSFTSAKMKVLGKGSSNGINTEFFQRSAVSPQILSQLRTTHAIREEDTVYCFIGRMVKDKGIVELITAFEALNNPCAWLFIIGSREQDLDPLPPHTVEVIARHPRIIETGFIKDVRPYLALSSIFVFPSYREGFPNVVMQAASMELPSIVTNINGCNEIITHEVSGLIIPVKDSKALERAMLTLARNAEQRSAMGAAGREYVAAHFKQEVLWNSLALEYSSLLNH